METIFSGRLLGRHGAFLILVLVSLLPASGIGIVAQNETYPPAFALAPGQSAMFHTSPGASLEIPLDTEGAKAAEILIETSGPGAVFQVVSAANREIKAVSQQGAAWAVISFPIDNRMPYRLISRTEAKSENAAGIQFRAEWLSVAPGSLAARAHAEALFSSAESLRKSDRAADIHDAWLNYRQAAIAWRSGGERIGEVLALAGQAQAAIELSEYDRSLSILDRALALSADTPWIRAWLFNLKSQVFLDQWNSDAARQNAQEALDLSRTLNDQGLIAEARTDLGESLYLVEDPSAADTIDEALQTAAQSDASNSEARALRCKAWLEEDLGHLTLAISLMRRAQASFRTAGDSRDALQAMANIATIEGMTGDHYGALMWHSKLDSLTRASGNVASSGFILENIGDDYAELNRDPDAIPKFSQAVETFARVRHLAGESISLGQKCAAELRLKRLDDALSDCRAAESIAERLHAPKRLAIATWRLGKVAQAQRRTAEAIQDFSRSFQISKQVQDSRFQAQALISWGDVLESMNRVDEALPLYNKALALSSQAEDSTRLLESEFRIGQSYAQMGDFENAKTELDITLQQIEKLRSAVLDNDLQASYFAAVRKCHELYVDILMSKHERNGVSAARALEISELGRARTLLDVLASRNSDESGQMRGNVSHELGQLEFAVQKAYDRRLKLLLEGGHRQELRQNSEDLTQAIDSLQRMEDADRDDAKAMVPSAHPLTAQEILQASKTSPTTLLEYALGAEQSYLWVVHGGTINSYVLKANQEEIEKSAGQWRRLATAHIPLEGDDAERELQGVAAKLSCLLLNNYIGPQDRKLAIVADGELATLPFASLPLNGCDARPGPPVITAHQVVMIPSLSIFLTHPMRDARTRFPKEVAIVANPVFDPGDDRVHIKPSDMRRGSQSIKDVPALPRLVGTGEEAMEIQRTVGPDKASVFLGFSASVETILSPEMRNYRILHLATHGIADESTPGFSGLVLSLVSPDGHPVFGYLKTHDIGNLDLHPDLVVLSACDSGAGSNLSGEGVTGLAYAFLDAGARQVASTLWDVDDEVTKDLMINFYKEMYSVGLDPADALRQSQILMMQSPHRSAPYYWAGFEITSIGN
jgi:CHAT domain-containing protein